MKPQELYPTLTIKSSHASGGYQGFTTVMVTGPVDHVAVYCDDYLHRWHPAGYGTTARLHETHANGVVTYRIWHSNSCE